MKALSHTQKPIRNAAVLGFALSFLLNFYHLLVICFHDRPMMMGERMRPMGVSLVTDYALNLLFIFLITFLLYLLYTLLKQLSNKWNSARWLKIPLVVALAPLLAHAAFWMHIHLYTYPEFIQRGIRAGYFGRTMLICVIVIAVIEVLDLLQKQQEQRLEIERLAAENSRSRYQALRNQVNPHFLFNSLNTLNSLIPQDSEAAQHYVNELSILFRHSLSQKETCTLEEELIVAKSYAYLMKIRYGEALSFRFDIPQEVLQRQVISFALQMLLENAVKHNTITLQKPMEINIRLNANGMLCVSNPLRPKRGEEESEGIGLQNLLSRYRLLAQNEIHILQTHETFEVEIPLI